MPQMRHVGSLPISNAIKTKLLNNGIEKVNEIINLSVTEINRCK